eukprot:sb/3470009/
MYPPFQKLEVVPLYQDCFYYMCRSTTYKCTTVNKYRELCKSKGVVVTTPYPECDDETPTEGGTPTKEGPTEDNKSTADDGGDGTTEEPVVTDRPNPTEEQPTDEKTTEKSSVVVMTTVPPTIISTSVDSSNINATTSHGKSVTITKLDTVTTAVTKATDGSTKKGSRTSKSRTNKSSHRRKTSTEGPIWTSGRYNPTQTVSGGGTIEESSSGIRY